MKLMHGLVAIVALAVGTCLAQDVHTDYDKKADFGQYHNGDSRNRLRSRF